MCDFSSKNHTCSEWGINGTNVKRYSLIIFQPQKNLQESYIKRVIGLPGADLLDGTIKVRVSWKVATELE